jgi:hypothetical protein
VLNKTFHHKYLMLIIIIFITIPAFSAQPVLNNPNIPVQEYFEVSDRLDKGIGYVTAKIKISMREENGQRFYYVRSREGDHFDNEMKLRHDDLTTIFEKRIDLRSNSATEAFQDLCNGIIYFFNKDNKIDKQFKKTDDNLYTRYSFFISLRGFPFSLKKEVRFKTYIGEYGDALTMRVINLGKEKISVKAGTFNCHKLELSIAGWQSVFAGDKFYFYFNESEPHQFIRYDEKDKDGRWYSNELLYYKKLKER